MRNLFKMHVHDYKMMSFTLRFHPTLDTHSKPYRIDGRDCSGEDWNLTWAEFMAKHCSFNLTNHVIKSTHGKSFKPNDKVKEFVKVFSRNVGKCIVKIATKGTGPKAVAKMAKNLQVSPKIKRPLQTQPQPAAAASPPPAKKKKMLPVPPAAPRISFTNVSSVNNTTTTANQNKNRNTTNDNVRLSRDNAPVTSGYLQRNLFNPKLELPATTTTIDVNARLYKRKYPEDDIKYPRQGPAINLNDDENGLFDFDDSSTVCSQDSVDSHDGTLPDIRTIILQRWAKYSNADFHKMLKEYREYDSGRKLKWMMRNPITNCCFGMVYDGLKANL